jgi:hypothetical protein
MRFSKFRMVLVQPALQLDRCQHRPSGMILIRNWRTKQRHEPIAQELIDRALIPVHFGQGQFKKSVQQGVHVFRPYARCQGGGIGEVAEQHRDLFPFAFEGTTGRQNLLRQVRWRVGNGCRGLRASG